MTQAGNPRKKPGPAPVYKHRQTFEFKGLTYRYDKTYEEWHLVEKQTAPTNVPRTIFGKHDSWSAGSLSTIAKTPIAALEAWCSSLIGIRTREADEAAQHAIELRAAVRMLKAKSWKPVSRA